VSPTDVRTGDKGAMPKAWGRWGRDLTVFFSVCLAAYSVFTTQKHLNDTVAEGKDRRDQSCILFERQEDSAIRQLRRTYKFLLNPPPQAAGLVPLAKAELSKTEADARASIAPEYCNEPNVGLFEPAHPQSFPERPKELKDLP
jgi:hypothetical protein